jgi:hypothetical protein
MISPVRSGCALFGLLVVAACGGGDGIPAAKLPELVLQPGDLPEVWVRFDEGRQGRADAPPGRRADPDRFGREGGWKARYRKPGSRATRGPLVIESRADLFAGEEGAQDDLELLRDELAGGLAAGARRIAAPALGDEAVAATVRQGAVRFYLIAWRQENVVGAILVNGFSRSLRLSDASELARKQARRIERAAEE